MSSTDHGGCAVSPRGPNSAMIRLDVEHRRAVDGVEPLDLDGQALDREERQTRDAEPVGPVLAALGEDADQRPVGAAARAPGAGLDLALRARGRSGRSLRHARSPPGRTGLGPELVGVEPDHGRLAVPVVIGDLGRGRRPTHPTGRHTTSPATAVAVSPALPSTPLSVMPVPPRRPRTPVAPWALDRIEAPGAPAMIVDLAILNARTGVRRRRPLLRTGVRPWPPALPGAGSSVPRPTGWTSPGDSSSRTKAMSSVLATRDQPGPSARSMRAPPGAKAERTRPTGGAELEVTAQLGQDAPTPGPVVAGRRRGVRSLRPDRRSPSPRRCVGPWPHLGRHAGAASSVGNGEAQVSPWLRASRRGGSRGSASAPPAAAPADPARSRSARRPAQARTCRPPAARATPPTAARSRPRPGGVGPGPTRSCRAV